jgi:hypothetical protein
LVEIDVIGLQAAQAGVQRVLYPLRQYIEAARLVRVLSRFEPEPWKLHVYRPQRGPVLDASGSVYDELVEKPGDATPRA